MNKRLHSHKKADSSASNPVKSQFQSRPFIAQAKPQSEKPLTQTETENQEFQQQKFEATQLNLQAKNGTITPEGQERLTVLQAKMSGTLQRRQASSNGSNFANIPISRPDAPSQLAVQTKLKIGEPGDEFEKDADQFAEELDTETHVPVSHQAGQNLQREEMSVEEKEIQTKPMLQLREASGGMTASAGLETEIKQAMVGGKQLPEKVREPIEKKTGKDYKVARVHADENADQLCQAVHARAFTTGRHMFFAKGEYNPASTEGRFLINHEAKHMEHQNAVEVQRAQKTQESGLIHSPANKATRKGTNEIQRVGDGQAEGGAREYTHIVIDKTAIGVGELLQSLNNTGLQTARTRKVTLAEGSVKLGHDRHVFMWDDTEKGRKGAQALINPGDSIKVRIRWNNLTMRGLFTQGTLKKDTMGVLGKGEETGAWAYEGDIDRRYIFIEGIDKESDPGYEDWKSGEGWPEDHNGISINAVKGARAITEQKMAAGGLQ
jgi:hypothetical protein